MSMLLQLARTPLPPAEAARYLTRYAYQCLVADIESECMAVAVPEIDATYYDIRPMLDYREHAPEVVDMAIQCLRLALACDLVAYHPQHAHLLRILPGEHLT